MDQDIYSCNEDSYECPQGINLDDRKELLQKIVDGQATKDEEKHFYQSMESCDRCQCRNLCEQHLEIKSMLKEKLNPKPVPKGLIEEIKSKISGTI